MTRLDTASFAPRGEAASARTGRAGIVKRILERLLAKLFAGLRCGRLRIVLPGGATFERIAPEPGPEATVALHRWRAVWRMATGGDIGAAEAYLDGDWTSPDLTAVVALVTRNIDPLSTSIRGARLIDAFENLRNRLRGNSRRGSRRNIEFHYDLGNDFFRLWLDEAMVYSAALWEDETLDLETAQRRKFERVAELMRLSPGESVLEIGFGWGGLAAFLAEQGGARVTGLSLSPSQLGFARDMITRRALADRVDLRLQDYRDVEGQFDRLVSIEMIEAVGEAYWPGYFDTIRRSLKPGGVAVIQAITIAEERYESYRRDTDFIQKYIFPGGFLPSKAALGREVRRAGLKLTAQHCFGASYALTLAEWRRRFHARWPEIAALGFDQRFNRLWDYYLCYCEAGFLEGSIDVGLYVIERE